MHLERDRAGCGGVQGGTHRGDDAALGGDVAHERTAFDAGDMQAYRAHRTSRGEQAPGRRRDPRDQHNSDDGSADLHGAAFAVHAWRDHSVLRGGVLDGHVVVAVCFKPLTPASTRQQQALCHAYPSTKNTNNQMVMRYMDFGNVSADRARTVAQTLHEESLRPFLALVHQNADGERIRIPDRPAGDAGPTRQNGDAAAFEQIYRRFERPVYTLALRMLGDAEAARDALHDAMLKAFQRIAQYRGERHSGRGCADRHERSADATARGRTLA